MVWIRYNIELAEEVYWTENNGFLKGQINSYFEKKKMLQLQGVLFYEYI